MSKYTQEKSFSFSSFLSASSKCCQHLCCTAFSYPSPKHSPLWRKHAVFHDTSALQKQFPLNKSKLFSRDVRLYSTMHLVSVLTSAIPTESSHMWLLNHHMPHSLAQRTPQNWMANPQVSLHQPAWAQTESRQSRLDSTFQEGKVLSLSGGCKVQ